MHSREQRNEEIRAFVKAYSQNAVAVSDSIWDYAETRFEEQQSAEVIIKALESEGFSVERNVAGMETAFIGTYGSGSPVVAYLGEYDALSGMSQEADTIEKKALHQGKPGHGCGHNLLGAGALAAAVAHKEYLKKHNLQGTVKYFGCPGEEGGSGKTYMARDKAFEGLDIAITWHPSSDNSMFATSTLANIQAFFRFKGKSAHAAGCPEMGRSALDAAELMNVGVNYLREHIIQDARVHYAVTNTGGLAPNVVQAEAEVLYLMRAPRIDQAKGIYERVCKIAQGAALMTETEVEIVFDKACSNYIPNYALTNLMYEQFKYFGGPEFDEMDREFAKKIRTTLTEEELAISTSDKTKEDIWLQLEQDNYDKELCDYLVPYFREMEYKVSAGSTDVGDASWNVPTAQAYVCTEPRKTVAHSWQWVACGKSPLAHKGMLRAAEIMAATALEACANPEIIEAAKKELNAKLAVHPYECPIPKGIVPKPLIK